MAYSVISFFISKPLLPELSIPAAGQKDRRLWGREWRSRHQRNSTVKINRYHFSRRHLKPGLQCDISISTSINISITNVHTCCINTRKVKYASANELRNEAVGVWDEARFQNGGRRNSPVAFAALYPQFSYHGCIYFWDLWMFTYQY